MARSITVDPQKLETAASSMDTQSADYEKVYRQLFSEVDGMAAAWQGVDNIAFTTQIKGFMDDFQAMVALMKQYSEFLKTSAKTYRATQSDIVNQSKRLTN
jgi:WXG100 family type VII secretion target